MKLLKIIISKYKSIKKPVEIDFSQGLLCFVGKNGSGKTNILQALKQFFSNERSYHSERGERATYKLIYELTDEEIKQFSDEITLSKEDRIVEIESQYRDFRATRVKAKIYEITLSKWKNKLNGLQAKIEKNLSIYYTQLEQLSNETVGVGTVINAVDIKEDSGEELPYYNYTSTIEHGKKTINQIRETVKKYIKSNFKKGSVNVNYENIEQIDYIWPLKLLKLEKINVDINPLLAQFTVINFNEYYKRIDEINEKNSKYFNEASSAIDEFMLIVNKITKLFRNRRLDFYQETDKRDKKYQSFLDLIKSTINYECFYLDNEDTLLFQVTNDYYRRQEIDSDNIIYKCIMKYLRKINVLLEDEDIRKLKKTSPDRIKVLKKHIDNYFSSLIPHFDKDRIKSLTANLSEDGEMFRYSIKEKNGVDISLESTSLGRRWYLSYAFLKDAMDNDDIIIIDEPASFLHPDAQKQILNDLVELSKTKKVIYCTNSIDMIPNNLQSYYFVDIDDSGTLLKQINIDDSNSVINALGLINYKSLIINRSISYIFVEGKTDKSLFEKFMELHSIDMSKYFIYSMEGAGNGKIIHKFLRDTNASYLFILDADTKTKFVNLDEIDHAKKVLVGMDKEEKCLEGIICDEDRIKYIRRKKVNENLIRNIKSFQDLTKNTIDELNRILIAAKIIDDNLIPT